MDLQSYLDRIHFEGQPKADRETLIQLHRRHLLAISYENIDIQLRRPVDLDIRRIYAKIVEQGRGGWCYEMNGLMNWALTEIGFLVTRVNGGVMRAVRGDDVLGNHLVLLVHLEQTWVADVGFGDGVIDPVPLVEGPIEQRGFHYRLERMADGFWRFHNHASGGAASFDFRCDPADEALFEEKCHFLQTSRESPFVMNLVCQRFVEEGYQVQVGRVARYITPSGVESRVLDNEQELIERLQRDFDLNVPEVAGAWPRIVAKHKELFGD